MQFTHIHKHIHITRIHVYKHRTDHRQSPFQSYAFDFRISRYLLNSRTSYRFADPLSDKAINCRRKPIQDTAVSSDAKIHDSQIYRPMTPQIHRACIINIYIDPCNIGLYAYIYDRAYIYIHVFTHSPKYTHIHIHIYVSH